MSGHFGEFAEALASPDSEQGDRQVERLRIAKERAEKAADPVAALEAKATKPASRTKKGA